MAAGAAKVYAGARNAADLAPLVARHGAKVVALQNAGLAAHAGGTFTDPQWIAAGRQEIDVNFFGTFAVTQASAPVLAPMGAAPS